jgi:hypothetical protein
LIVSIMWTGMRIVRAWSAMARGDRLADPPRRVGRELVAAAVLELVDRLHQADVAFLNQVEELQAAVGVLLGDRDDEPEVGFDQLLLRLLGLRLAALMTSIVRRRRSGVSSRSSIICLTMALKSFCLLKRSFFSSSFSFGPLALHLRVELTLDRVGVALHALHRVHGVLDLVHQAPLDRFGELDLANPPRHLDPRAHRLEAGAAVLLLVLLGDFLELLAQLRVAEPRLAHHLDLAEDFFLALLDHLVGDFLVAEDHELADRALAGAQLIARSRGCAWRSSACGRST